MNTSILNLDKISSSTRHVDIGRRVCIGPEIKAQPGYVLAVRVLTDKVLYDQLEVVTGRMVKLRRDDLLAVTLGSRSAAQGFAGKVPESVAVGDTLQILNMGGVCGSCTAFHPSLGRPFDVEVLGSILSYPSMEARIGVPANIRNGPVKPAWEIETRLPVIYIAGTSMNSGKTTAACEIIKELGRSRLTVAACKLTGVSLMRDTLNMTDAGALSAYDFTDAGLPVTTSSDALTTAKGLFNKLSRERPDVVVAELGDGILGTYGVCEILKDPELMSLAAAHVICASDPVGVHGAAQIFKERYSQEIAVVSGPATDNAVGRDIISNSLGFPAFNAFQDAQSLGRLLLEKVELWH